MGIQHEVSSGQGGGLPRPRGVGKAYSNPVVQGRKLCTSPYHKGPRWLLITNFQVRKRLPSGVPLYYQSYCSGCNAAHQKELRQSGRRTSKAEKRRRDEHWYNQTVDARPFIDYLNLTVREIGYANVLSAVRSDDGRLTTFLRGYYYKNKKKYPVKGVTLRVADEWMSRLGGSVWELYPDLLEE